MTITLAFLTPKLVQAAVEGDCLAASASRVCVTLLPSGSPGITSTNRASRIGAKPVPGAGLRVPDEAAAPATAIYDALHRPVQRWLRVRDESTGASYGTTQRSIAAMASAWLRRNVRQVCDGGPRRRIMYLETVDSAISNPSLSSSPWMRGAPHNGFCPAVALAARPARLCCRRCVRFRARRTVRAYAHRT
jgi:hypothetical protein